VKIEIVYSTTNPHKQAEIGAISRSIRVVLPDGSSAMVGDVFDFVFRDGRPIEPLERNLEEMVRHKSISAYRNLLVPCIVEHAGLIFEEYLHADYPGGLTQPMWDALGATRFISETNGQGRRVIARAMVGYGDGLNVRCFRGETRGILANQPKGSRDFYWDTIFIPENESQTYAEICSDPAKGIERKVAISQPTKALLGFLNERLKSGTPPLFA
jgi:XTP/dITP diphosphohydrolase